jgi:signal transduction histidine kinase
MSEEGRTMTELNFSTPEPTNMTETEAVVVRRYDRQRRQRLLIVLGTTFASAIGVLFAALLVSFIVFPNQAQNTTSTISQFVGVAVNAAIFVLVVVLARRDKISTASILFAVGAGVIPNLNVLAISATRGPDPISTIFLIGAIVIVSIVGPPWMILSTTVLSTLTTTYMLFLAPVPPFLKSLFAADVPGIFPMLLVTYWGLAGMILVNWRSYQRTLYELADVRVQVERARQLDNLKDQFIRSVNHELRTPIMAVLGYIDLLMDPIHRASAEKTDRFIKRAHRSGQSLRTLLSSILDTRRLELDARDYQPERVDVFGAIEDVIPLIPVEHYQGQIIERALHVTMPEGLHVWADPVVVQQVLINLLGNAVKYSEPGTPVDINARVVTPDGHPAKGRLRAEKRERHMVEIAIRDYGFGIPPQQIPLLFQRFVRLQRDLESNIVGTGLGLYLCRSLVEKMGGRIWVTSTGIPREGSTFFIQLPLPAGDENEIEQGESSPPPISVERRTGPLTASAADLAALQAIIAPDKTK